jgi:formiminoglutamate deiminase
VTTLWCESALIDSQVAVGVRIEIVDGRFAAVETEVGSAGAHVLPGFTVPGFANAHSHAFHRTLRSRTQRDRGSFWTWREVMYGAAERLDPAGYRRLARAVFAEMVSTGVSCVGEFHYLHHQRDGTPYADPNEMGRAVLAAADEAGLRITLLDTLYLHGGVGAGGYTAPGERQLRFVDADAEAWAQRVGCLAATDRQRIGAAIHSVRAVDPPSAAVVAEWAADNDAPLHAHVSEQRAENEACLAHHGTTPVGALAEAGVLSDRFSAVHATHVSDTDISALASSGSTVVMCPTTERDLGDGIGPSADFVAAGVSIALGSDSHAVVDMFEEARAVELDERLGSRTRGTHPASALLRMATADGHRSLGWDDAGAIEVGGRADLVTLSLGSIRLAGTRQSDAVEAAVFAATAADVRDVHIDGRHVVVDGQHTTIEVAAELRAAVREVMGDD